MKAKTKPPAKQADARSAPLAQFNNHASPARINMLDTDNFTVALLGEFGYYRRVIAQAMGLTIGQVNRRLKFAQVDPAAYRRGESVIGQMILRGVAKAGVPQLRQFAEHTLAEHLRQLGWSAAGIKPELEEPELSTPPTHELSTSQQS